MWVIETSSERLTETPPGDARQSAVANTGAGTTPTWTGRAGL